MTLVALHGFTGAPASWAYVLERLRAREPHGPGPTVLAPFLAGHGPRPVRVEGFEDEVYRLCELVRDRAEPPVHLAAYSMGARVALALLTECPDLFERATLIGARDGLADPTERRQRGEWERRWITLLETKGLSAFLESWEALPLWETQHDAPAERLAAQRSIRESHTPDGLAHAVAVLGLAAMPALADRLGKVDAEVTLMTGSLDPKFDRLAEPLERLIPRCRRLTVDGAGHNLLLERPDAVASALNRDGSG
jgi:2-succinyl-6-hydroxy-2,4-cyclohexadiene-1-carboxylate synthase